MKKIDKIKQNIKITENKLFQIENRKTLDL